MSKIIQVRGTASFPRLNEPDTKFDAAGVFNTKLILSAEAAAPLVARFDQMRDAEVSRQAELSNGKKPVVNDHPLNPEYDEDGAETGNWVLSCRMKASGISKKTGKAWSRQLPLFDSKGSPTSVRITGGSDIICAIEPISYGVAGKEKGKPIVTCGVSLRLEAVQLIQTSGGSRDAGGYGFGQHEGGFVAAEGAEEGSEGETEEGSAVSDGSEYKF